MSYHSSVNKNCDCSAVGPDSISFVDFDKRAYKPFDILFVLTQIA